MRVMIIDKFEICRSGFKFVLEDSFENCIICEANSIAEALSCLESHGSDMVLLTMDSEIDVKDPHVVRLIELAHKIPVVVVGDVKGVKYFNSLLQYNVRGFLDRASSKDVMIAALQLILAGGQYFPPEFHESDQLPQSDVNGDFRTQDTSVGRLTRRQMEVLQAVALGKSNKVIAAELGISPGTVKVHISNLMKDLHASNRTQAVSIANSLNILSQPH